MQTIIAEYRASLKMPEAEEILDLFFYRPAAFIFVKLIYKMPITPNGVTLLSLIAGLAAAWELSASALGTAAVWYAVANILDCSDGQLARLQHSGTPLGRLVDGVADYISSVAIFLGIGIGLSRIEPHYWWLVVAGGISSAIQAFYFDYHQGEFISTVRGEQNFLDRELDRFARTPDGAPRREGTISHFFIQLYVRYLSLQEKSRSSRAEQHQDRERYRLLHSPMIRWWSFLGPTTNRTLLIVCALLGRVDLFLWLVVTLGNAWLVNCGVRERGIQRSGRTVSPADARQR